MLPVVDRERKGRTLCRMQYAFNEETFAVRWSALRPDDVENAVTAAIATAQNRLDAIAQLPLVETTFANTFLALEAATDELDNAWGRIDHLNSVCHTPAWREAYNQMLPAVTDFRTRIPLNSALWQRLQHVETTARDLPPLHQRLLEETVADFRKHGADLPEEQKARLEAISRELSQTTQKFSENVLDATNAWEHFVTDEAELAGLPDSAKAAARADATAKGRPKAWRFTQQFPSVLPVMQYADSDALRRIVWEGSNAIARQAPWDNRPLIRDILRLRQEMAELLGKPHFADHVLERRMAQNGTQALAFIEDLHARAKDAFESEVTELRNFKASQTGQASEPLEPWETSYWAEKQRQARYAFDEEQVRPYFALPQIIDGMFKLTEELFGVRIHAVGTLYRDPETGTEQRNPAAAEDCVEVWHPEVEFFKIHDADGTLLGGFYADWFPRETKRAGAWMNPLHSGRPQPGGGLAPHLGLMAGNMNRPTGDAPALLTHREVETIFHEFGHLLHHLLSRVELPSLGGTNVAWDFVELPSQIMENWCWEPEALNRFARHYKTQEPLPAELLDKMLAARNYLAGSATMRQLAFSKLDLALHLEPAQALSAADLDAHLDSLMDGYRAELKTPAPNIAPRFSHLFSDATGYAAGYYSYKWAEVLDADAFTRFQAEGIFNTDTGRAFREQILAQGNSAPPEQLFRNFMGRDPDANALLKRCGLA